MMHSHTNTSGCLEAVINKTTVRSLLRLRPQNVHILLVLLLGLWATVGQASSYYTPRYDDCIHGRDMISEGCYECEAETAPRSPTPSDTSALKVGDAVEVRSMENYYDGVWNDVFTVRLVEISPRTNECVVRAQTKVNGVSVGRPEEWILPDYLVRAVPSGRNSRSPNSKRHCNRCRKYSEFCGPCEEANGSTCTETTKSFSPYGRRLVDLPRLEDYYFDENGNFDPNGTHDRRRFNIAYDKAVAQTDANQVCTLCWKQGRIRAPSVHGPGLKGSLRNEFGTIIDKCPYTLKPHTGQHKFVESETLSTLDWAKVYTAAAGRTIGFSRRLGEDDVTLRRLAEDNVNSLTAFCGWALMLLIVVVVYTLTKMGKRSAMQRRHLSKTQVAF